MTSAKQADPGRLQVRQYVEAGADAVFDAFTDAGSMTEWMRPGPGMSCRCALDPRVGGRYTIDMIAPDGTTLLHEGVYRVVDRPRKLVFTWASAPTQHRETVVTVELLPKGTGTEVVLTHEGLHLPTVDPHAEGWTAILRALADTVERGGGAS